MNQQTRQMLSERFDLSFIEWQCLAFLGERGDLTAAEICRLTGYDKAQVSHALRDLAKRKLIHRATTTAKAVPIELTTDGRDLFKRCVTARRRLERAHLERLSPEQRVALYEALTILGGLWSMNPPSDTSNLQKSLTPMSSWHRVRPFADHRSLGGHV